MILWVKTIIDKIVINGLEKKFNNFFLNEKISLADPEFITHGEFLINWKKKKLRGETPYNIIRGA
jgi:hypothetical protein